MKMTPRPTSPTSLLWAHQLKREHGHLLGRIQELEIDNKQQEDRLSKADTSNNDQAKDEIAALAQQVKAVDKGGVKQRERLTKVEKVVMSKLDHVQAENEAILLKMNSLEKDEVLAEQERRKAFSKEKVLLKRVGEVETNLKQYEESLQQVNRRVDENSVGTIKTQLEILTQQVQREGAEMKRLEDSLTALDSANTELRQANEKLAAEIMKLAPKSEPQPAAVTPTVEKPAIASGRKIAAKKGRKVPVRRRIDPESNDDNDDINATKRPKKKSHKWKGGGADLDVIRQAQLEQEVANTRPRRSTSFRTATPPAPHRPNVKPLARPKSAAKTMIAKTKAAAKPARKSDPQLYLDNNADKPIIRAGKGWIEVATTPVESDAQSSEDELAGTTGRGQPRKSLRQDTLAELGQRITRGARQQYTQARDMPSTATTLNPKLQPMKTSKNYAANMPTRQPKVCPPQPSSPGPGLPTATGNPVLGAPKDHPREPSPKRRRIDLGSDDDAALLAQY